MHVYSCRITGLRRARFPGGTAKEAREEWSCSLLPHGHAKGFRWEAVLHQNGFSSPLAD